MKSTHEEITQLSSEILNTPVNILPEQYTQEDKELAFAQCYMIGEEMCSLTQICSKVFGCNIDSTNNNKETAIGQIITKPINKTDALMEIHIVCPIKKNEHGNNLSENSNVGLRPLSLHTNVSTIQTMNNSVRNALNIATKTQTSKKLNSNKYKKSKCIHKLLTFLKINTQTKYKAKKYNNLLNTNKFTKEKIQYIKYKHGFESFIIKVCEKICTITTNSFFGQLMSKTIVKIFAFLLQTTILTIFGLICILLTAIYTAISMIIEIILMILLIIKNIVLPQIYNYFIYSVDNVFFSLIEFI